MESGRVFHVISNTHWDREWRFSFQRNRQLLVEMMDKTLEILASEPEYRAFHLDSQSVVLQDYLEIRPGKKELIQRLVRDNRLLIGPWFILPDEFQVGGESLVRNLLLGHRICAQFGPVMKVGYSPFSWGQVSQLPQIYHEFGIDVVMFYRGINSLDSPKAEFIWEGADGTRLLASRFSTMPRYNFYFYIYRPVVHNEQIADIEYQWKKGGLPFHFADADLKDEDYNLLQPLNNYYKENLQPAVAAIIRDQVDDFTTPHIFWAEGHDSSGPNLKTVQIIKDIAELLPGDQVIHSTLEQYVQGLKECANFENLPMVRGERRSSQFDRRSGNLYGYTTSARMYLKQINFTTEKWLQFYAEPFNALANLLGLNIDDRYLEIAWQLLLQNSAHDSIGGCSLDAIHDDMENRYKQCQEISHGVFARACKHLARRIDLNNYDSNSIHLVVLNPNTFERNDVVPAYIDIPTDMDKGGIIVKDSVDQPIPLQLVQCLDAEPVLEQMIDRPMYLKMKRYHCYLDLKSVPSFGFKTLHVCPGDQIDSTEKIGRLEGHHPVMENCYLRLEVNNNGTINVMDKQTGKRYSDLAYFYDEGEAGHAWVHVPVAPFLDTKTANPTIEFSLNGPLICICRIHYLMAIPQTLSDRKIGANTARLSIELNVILKKEAKQVEFHVKLINPAESHRLRLMFPLGINANYSYGEGQFDVVARSTIRPATENWLEQPMYDYPMHHFVDISDGIQGAAIFVNGLKEYEVLNDDQNTLAVTLLRAFTYVIQPSSLQDFSHQKGSQCSGQQDYHLAFYPHAGTWESANVYSQALAFHNELRLFQIGKTTGDLAPDTSFMDIQPENLIFSCLKQSEHKKVTAVILRLYNPTQTTIAGKIRLYIKPKMVYQVTLEEKFVRKIPIIATNRLEINVNSKKIFTLALIFE